MSINKSSCSTAPVYQGLLFNNQTGVLSIYPNGNSVDLSTLVTGQETLTYIQDFVYDNQNLTITYVGEDKIPVQKSVFIDIDIPEPIPPEWGDITGDINEQTDLMAALSEITDNIPTLTSELTNDSGYLTVDDLPPDSQGVWGAITGDIEDQTDLQDALDLKVNTADIANVAYKNINNEFSADQTIFKNAATISLRGTAGEVLAYRFRDGSDASLGGLSQSLATGDVVLESHFGTGFPEITLSYATGYVGFNNSKLKLTGVYSGTGGVIEMGNYGSFGSGYGTASLYFGTGIKPNLTNIGFKKMSSDTASWVKALFSTGISFHTGVTGTEGDDISEEANRRMLIANNGNVTIDDLAGTGDRYVKTSAAGLLSSQTGIPQSDVTGLTIALTNVAYTDVNNKFSVGQTIGSTDNVLTGKKLDVRSTALDYNTYVSHVGVAGEATEYLAFKWNAIKFSANATSTIVFEGTGNYAWTGTMNFLENSVNIGSWTATGLTVGTGSQSSQLVIGGTGPLAGIYSPAYSSTASNIINFKDYNGNVRMTLDMSGGAVGNLSVTGTTTSGVAQIGNWPTAPTYAMFKHSAQAADDYAFMQGPTGDSNFNSKALQPMAFRFSNIERMRLIYDGLYIGGAANPATLLHLNNTSGQGQLRFSNSANYWQIGRDQDLNGDFIIDNQAGNKFKIDNSTGAVQIVQLTNAAIGYVKSSTAGVLSRQTGIPDADLSANIPRLNGLNTFTAVGDQYHTFTSTTLNVQTVVGSDSAGSGFSGTLTNHPFAFRTNNTARVSISTAGAIQFNAYTSGFLRSDGSGNITSEASGVTATELGYLDGVTSSIQGQIDAQWFEAELLPWQGAATTDSGKVFRNLIQNGSGSTASATVSNTSIFTSYGGNMLSTAATSASYANWRAFNANSHFTLGNAAGIGGFKLTLVFGAASAATVANEKMFCGLYNSNNALTLTTDPAAQTNVIGIGYDGSTDTNMQIMHNDGSGSCTKIDLGANFPIKTLSTAFYRLVLYCTPNASSVNYIVKRLDTGDIATGTLSTNLPANTLFLNATTHISNGATALVSTLKFFKAHAYIGSEL